MSRKNPVQKVLRAVYHFMVFFQLVGFIVSCCTMLFVSTMQDSMGLVFTNDNIQSAARITMANVLVLTTLFTAGDSIRRKLTVQRPAKRILDAGEKIMAGDFSVRIPVSRNPDRDDPFQEIAECFNQMAQELSSTETLRTDFVANVSHELKTPLAVMQNYGSLLQQPDLPEEKRLEYARSIVDASRRLATLISNILKLNKLENQQVAPQFTKYDLSEQVCQCLLGFEEVWERKNLNIETDIQDGITVQSDPEMMELVWNNLFSNAMKFTPDGGTISVSVTADEQRATVTVSDTGCGISPEVGKHIFDKFYQGDTSHATQGNGLGLALVKRVVDLTGSAISVQSELGKGTTFTVTLGRNNQ